MASSAAADSGEARRAASTSDQRVFGKTRRVSPETESLFIKRSYPEQLGETRLLLQGDAAADAARSARLLYRGSLVCRFRRHAGWQPAVRQSGRLRYGFACCSRTLAGT